MSLTARTIEALVEALRRKDADATIFAIRTASRWAGAPEMVIDGRTVAVREARTPLKVREVLHEDTGGRDLVVLTDLDEQSFGGENLARVALRRLEAVQPWPVVQAIYGVASIDPALTHLPWMADRLIEAPAAARVVSGGTLDVETAWGVVLDGFGLSSARPSEDELLKAAATERFGLAYSGLPADGRSELRRILQDALGRLAGIVLQVVERGHGAELLALGIVAECVYGEAHGTAERIRGAFGERFGARGLDATIASRWGAAARRLLVSPESSGAAMRIRQRADDILCREMDGAELAVASSELPTGYQQRLIAVAHHVTRILGGTNDERALEDVDEAVRRVQEHVLASGGHREGLRALMAARLLRWLAAPRTELIDVAEALRRYVDEDSWVDQARVSIREGDSLPETRAAYERLSERVRLERERLNAFVGQRVASLPLPYADVIGVEDVLRTVAAPLTAERKVALIVMDGMSGSIANLLVASLEGEHWIRHRPRARSAMPIVLSAFPSATEFSRTSLLSGKLRTGGQSEEVAGFREFLSANNLGTSKSPHVFHKDSLTGGSLAIEEALHSSAKIVPIVINAIDAQLSGSEQLQTDWNLGSIPVLERIVRTCERVGRAIVLVSDHGHIVEDQTVAMDGSGIGVLLPGARWRGPGIALRPGEVEASGPRVLVRGNACVVAVDERIRYVGKYAGYHGGLTPQEVVCPLSVLIHRNNDGGLVDWLPLETTRPVWWGSAPAMTRAPQANSGRPRIGQTDVIPVSTVAAPPSDLSWIEALIGSANYDGQCRLVGRVTLSPEVVKKMLGVLAHSAPAGATQIRMTEQAFAARMECAVSELRKRASLLSRLLNIDAYPVFTQADSETYQLDLSLLLTQFELGA